MRPTPTNIRAVLISDRASLEPVYVDLVADSGRTYHVHRQLLCASSAYFAAALSGRYTENTDNQIHLSDTKELVLSMYVDWLELGDWLNTDAVTETTLRVLDSTERYDAHLEFYIFADKYGIPQLKRLVMTRMMKMRLKVPTQTTYFVGKIVQHLPDTDPMCEWLAYAWKARQANANDVNGLSALPSQFVERVLIIRPTCFVYVGPSMLIETRNYHQHDDPGSRTNCLAKETVMKLII